MAQQGMTIVSAILADGVSTLSDILILAVKDFLAKRVDVNNSLTLDANSTETTIVTQTAGTGKDMYLGSGSFKSSCEEADAVFNCTFRLKVNGTTIETYVERRLVPGDEWDYEFKTKGSKVTTGQVIEITIQNSNGAVNRQTRSEAKLVLWEEDTNVNPNNDFT